MSPVLSSHFSEYAAFHKTRGNQACHYVGIPLIVLTLFTMLTRVELVEVGGWSVTLAEVIMLAVVAYYLTLDVPLGLLSAPTIRKVSSPTPATAPRSELARACAW